VRSCHALRIPGCRRRRGRGPLGGRGPHDGPAERPNVPGRACALGGDTAGLKLGDIDPLKAYEDVKRQITSGNLSGSLNLGSAPNVTFPKLGDLSVGNKMQLDEGAIRRAIGAGINSQIQQNNRRMEDISAYARNPTAWHGLPPH